jgi:alkylhydroperoxidase/carboxymuconolactone decarboxylase family protein YurZ
VPQQGTPERDPGFLGDGSVVFGRHHTGRVAAPEPAVAQPSRSPSTCHRTGGDYVGRGVPARDEHRPPTRRPGYARRHRVEYYTSQGNCFGDYLTRTGIDVPTRELLTFAMLASLGGCDAQVKGHVVGNLNVGNDRARLLSVLTALIPFIGYPRTLNALQAVDEITRA